VKEIKVPCNEKLLNEAFENATKTALEIFNTDAEG